MSSLYRLLRKQQKVFVPRVLGQDEPDKSDKRFVSRKDVVRLAEILYRYANPPDCILVNAQNVADDMVTAFYPMDIRTVPCPMPPFQNMWIEFSMPIGAGKQRFAVQTHRTHRDDKDGHLLTAAMWTELNGAVCGPSSLGVFPLDHTGAINRDRTELNVFHDLGDEKSQEAWEARFTFVIGCGLQALSRMNCKNVELRPINEGKSLAHAPNKLVPASVWHEIVVTSVPKSIAGGRDVLNPGKENEIRSHWIRGHYADYRKGKGLFGKIHGLFWIPECRRGNEALGQVIPEYTIQ